MMLWPGRGVAAWRYLFLYLICCLGSWYRFKKKKIHSYGLRNKKNPSSLQTSFCVKAGCWVNRGFLSLKRLDTSHTTPLACPRMNMRAGLGMVKRPTAECFLFKGALILMYHNKGHFSQISEKAHWGIPKDQFMVYAFYQMKPLY